MIWRRVASSALVSVFGLALALAPLSTTPAGATKAPKHKAAKHTPASAKTLAGRCTALNGERTQSSKLATSLESAIASGNFATIKAAVLSEFSELDNSIAKGKAYLSSAPANVQAAFASFAGVFNQLKSEIQGTTSLAQLEQVFESLGTNAKLLSASKVISSYYGSYCGAVTTTT